MEMIKNNVITTKQKKKFFQFCLDAYTGKLKGLGFCSMYRKFFGDGLYDDNVITEDFILLPELKKHKPNIFYDFNNDKTTSDSQFWFPVGKDQSKRIEICKKILATLE